MGIPGPNRPPTVGLKRSNHWALSAVNAAAVLILVVTVAGAGTYIAVTDWHPGVARTFSCAPPSADVCKATLGAHDVGLLAPFRYTQQGQRIPFTAVLLAGERATAYTFDFGDGTGLVRTTSPTVDHGYANPGTYLVYVRAMVNGLPRDNAHGLVPIRVLTSYSADTTGDRPSVLGSIPSNSTSKANPTAVLQPGQSATFSGVYSSGPTNPAWILQPPRIVASPGADLLSGSRSDSTAQATVAFSNSGDYTVTFVGSAKSGAADSYANYTWTVFVAPSGIHAGIAAMGQRADPHPGTVVAYEDSPGGAGSLDPAQENDPNGFEVDDNVYQQLVDYNWSDVGATSASFVPQLATCVPGSLQCQRLYGNPLVSAAGTDYTFVINGQQQFYDPYTGAHWGVYPSDVVFSYARTMAFADLPCDGCNANWVLAQALAPSGNGAWDAHIHWPFNNTPQAVLGSMSVNDSRWCPAAATTRDHGCVTFHAEGGGHAWPFFLELLADHPGTGILSCAWASSNSANGGGVGLPYWTANPGAGPTLVTGTGDRPCALPGGATSTNSTAYGNALRAIPPTAWDGYEILGSSETLGNVYRSMVGSGPYYLADYAIGSSYTLRASPAYVQNPYCTWTRCQPRPGQYAATVDVVWETSPTIGEQAYEAGSADEAAIPSSDTALLLQLIEQGKINALVAPQLVIGFYSFALEFGVGRAQAFLSQPVTAPSDLFSYIGVRQFMVRAYPYTAIESTVNTLDGIQYGFNYGGAIPQFLGNYYPTNISWPSGDPCASVTNPSCAGYWWHQVTTPGTPYYDRELAGCTAAAPCVLPLMSYSGDPPEDQRAALWSDEVSALSGGRIEMKNVDISFVQFLINTRGYAPGTTPDAVGFSFWGPDYPDPSDFADPFYLPDAGNTYETAVSEQLQNTSLGFNGTVCRPWTDFGYYASLASVVPNDCQGAAYAAMAGLVEKAEYAPVGPDRVLWFNMAERIANQLALYVWAFQAPLVATAASWVSVSSINPSVELGGLAQWYALTGDSVQFPGSV